MSAQAFSWVCEHSDAQGTDRLVLLVLANYAGDLITNGTGAYFECWPGIERVAEEARLDSPRTVQNALTRLVTSGQLERIVNAAPDGRIRNDRRPNLYRIHTRPRPLPEQIGKRLTADDIARHPALRRRAPAVDNPDGVSSDDTPSEPRGVVSRRDGVSSRDATGCRETTPKPLVEPLEKTPRVRDARATAPDTAVDNSSAGGADERQGDELTHRHPLARRAATAPDRLEHSIAERAAP